MSDLVLQRQYTIGVYIDQIPANGGGFQYIEFVLDALYAMKSECEVKVLFLNDELQEKLMAKYPSFKLSYLSYNRNQVDEIINVVNSSGCDYLILPISNKLAWVGAEFSIPVIASIHDVMQFYEHYYEPSWPGYQLNDIVYMQQRTCRRAVGVLVDSDLGKEQLLHVCGNLYNDKVFVQPFRVPGYLYDEKEEKPEKLRSERFIYYPAQIWGQKNHVSILLAMEQLLSEGIKVNAVFSGAATIFNDTLARLCKKLGLENQVEYLGYVPDSQVKWLLHHARAMVMPGFMGPTNIPPLEAMFMGCPVIVSNLWAMPEQMGDAAIYVNPKYPWDIAEAIKQVWLYDDVYRDLSGKGKEQAKKYSREIFNTNFKNNLISIIDAYERDNSCLDALLEECRGNSIYIYGAGEYGYWTTRFLNYKGVSVDGIIVKDKMDNPEILCGHPVFEMAELVPTLNNAKIILALSEKYQQEVMYDLKDLANGPLKYYQLQKNQFRQIWLKLLSD